jgi:hypothetical protein
MIYTLDVTGTNGTPFRVLAIPASEQGPNKHRAPAGRSHPIVEFYDRRYPHEPEIGGQFTGGYYDLRTLLDLPGGYGHGRIGADGRSLSLYGGEPAWTLDAEACELVAVWLEQLYDRDLLD